VHQGIAHEGVDLHRRVALGTEQEQGAEQMVEPSLGTRNDDDAFRSEPDGLVERQLEVGLVLRARVAHDASSCRFGGAQRLRRDGVEIAEDDIHVEAERQRTIEAAVGRDDGPSVGNVEPRAQSRGDYDDVRVLHTYVPPLALPRSGSAGRQRALLPSQPGCPELPGSLS
jgi:hypothetical protein